MKGEPLLNYDLLSRPAFVRDLRSFLSLSSDVLSAIAEVGDSADGFAGYSQARGLSDRFAIRVDKIVRDLHMAEYIYDRCVAIDMDVADAVDELASVGAQLETSVSLTDEQKDAIKSILILKREYETSKAFNRAATSNGPHFLSFHGSWSVKSISVNPGLKISAPVLAISIVWHDAAGNSHEAFFQMNDRDWRKFTDDIAALSESRSEIDELL